jgi:hypothetical protein
MRDFLCQNKKFNKKIPANIVGIFFNIIRVKIIRVKKIEGPVYGVPQKIIREEFIGAYIS